MAVHKRGGDDCEVVGRTVVEVKSEERRVKNPMVLVKNEESNGLSEE